MILYFVHLYHFYIGKLLNVLVEQVERLVVRKISNQEVKPQARQVNLTFV